MKLAVKQIKDEYRDCETLLATLFLKLVILWSRLVRNRHIIKKCVLENKTGLHRLSPPTCEAFQCRGCPVAWSNQLVPLYRTVGHDLR